MKKILFCIILFLIAISGISQNTALKVQKIVLDNGFTVFLNEDKTAKEVFGAVVIKAGSKNDPADATGMAHYLEHLLFKGTTELGTIDYEKEKLFLDSINFYYDLLGKTKDNIERIKIQQLINIQSVQASKYSLPNEFDKLVKSIGGTHLNAFTTEEITVYHNAFPGEQTEKWLELYSHRFLHPIFRSFQSELEVVYEEKNMAMDNYQTKLIEEINKNLFKYHPYGTQTTIGTVEHLKNPSLTKMYDYFNKYYVANNMALVLCGNFDTDKTLPLINDKFSKLRTGTVPLFPEYPQTNFTKKEVLEVNYTPIKVTLLGFKTIPNTHSDKAALEVFVSLFFNESETGKLNKLQRDGKLIYAGGFSYAFNDDGAVIFFIVPKLVGQSFDEAEELLFNEIHKIKSGDLSEKDLQIIKTELYRQKQQQLENCEDRAFNIIQAFSEGIAWEDFIKYNDELESVTKEDVIRVSQKYFGDNYFVLHSKTGFPPKEILSKPEFKPISTDQTEESVFAKFFLQDTTNSTEPKFLNFERDAILLKLNESNKLYVTPNPINDVFTLKVEFSIGKDNLQQLDLAASLFNYFRIKDMNTDSLKEEFALFGLTYIAWCKDQRFVVEFTGLDKNFEKSLWLINKLVFQPQVEESMIDILKNEIISERKINENEPDVLGEALFEYGRLGRRSDYINRTSTKELKKLTAQQLLNIYKNAISYNAVWHYVGQESPQKIHELILANLSLLDYKKDTPLQDKINNSTEATIIYLVNDKKAAQSQIYFIVNSNAYNYSPKMNSSITAFNQYIGGSFLGLILQEIREFRSLAYSAGGKFVKPQLQNGPSYFYSYLGCQADKTNEAIKIMYTLIDTMPEKQDRMHSIKSLLKNSTSTYYPSFREISSTIENFRQRGYNSNPIKDEYFQYEKLNFRDITKFYELYVKDKPMIITIYGNKSKINLAELAQYGKITELKKRDIILD